MNIRTDLLDKNKCLACKDIPDLLYYLVKVLDTELYEDNKILCNLINDFYRDESKKRFYIRAITDDNITKRCLKILEYDDVIEQSVKLKQLITDFCDKNAYSPTHGTSIVNAFARAIGLNAIKVSDILLESNFKGQRKIVVDTSVLLKRPALIYELLERFDQIIIPEIVLKEINHQKDKGKKHVQQKAWLVLNTLNRIPKNRILFPNDKSNFASINDERIVNVAKEIALENQTDLIYVLANDVLFPLLTHDAKNIKMLTYDSYVKEFPKSNNCDIENTKKFILSLKSNDFNKINTILNMSGIDINFIDSETGLTPLIIAIRNKNVDIIKLIINHFENVIDLDKRDNYKYNFTPILHAVQLKRLDIIKILYEHGADIDVCSSGKNAGNTPLMVCAWHGFLEGVKFFLENGACANQQDNNGYTALTKACIKGYPAVAKLLIDKTDLNIRSRENKKAYEYIKQSDQEFLALFKDFVK